MYELDFLGVGDGEKSGDAIALRFTSPADGHMVVGVIDAGFQETGDRVVDHVNRYYRTNHVDFVLSTHPDGDHINGMGVVMRSLDVGTLLIHRPGQHGYPDNSGSRPAEELVQLARAQGAEVVEPFTGVNGFGNALVVAGPSRSYYGSLLTEQAQTRKSATKPSFAERYFGESAVTQVRKMARRVLDSFPLEIAFDDADGDNARNNSSVILSLSVDNEHLLLAGDAGVPAITQALNYLDSQYRTVNYPRFFALPHHGSRHNLDLETIQRILGPRTRDRRGTVFASVSRESALPSPRVANACGRRGYRVIETRGWGCIRHASPDAPKRAGSKAVDPLPPLYENDHD